MGAYGATMRTNFSVQLPALGAALLLGAAVVTMACAPSAGAQPATAMPTPVEAVGAYVRADGNEFAGRCEETISPRDLGKVCARMIEARSGTQAWLIGRTFSEFNQWVFVSQQERGWRVAANAPLDFFDTSGAIPWP